MSTPNFRNLRDVVADNTVSTGVSSVFNRALVVSRVTSPAAANATANLTIAQMFGGILTSNNAGNIVLTTPIALTLYQGSPQFRVGDSFNLSIVNTSGTGTVTLAGGDASVVTTGGGSMVVAAVAGLGATFQIRFTGGTVTAPTFQIYRIA